MQDTDVMVGTRSASLPESTTSTSRSTSERVVTRVHVLTLLAAAGFLIYESTQRWFFGDEWNFLAGRGLRLGRTGIFYPYNQHWVTIPIVIWRALFNVVGVHDYWLYSLPVVAAQLVACHMLWRIMLRHDVEPWTATLLVAAFAVVGAGWQNLTWAFQISFVGSLAFGLLAVDAVERDRPWMPASWGVCSLLCSGVGVPMVFAAGLVALVRRKPRIAASAVLIPGAIFLIWYEYVGRTGRVSAIDTKSLHLGNLFSFVWTGLTASTAGFLDAPHAVGIVALVVLAVVAVVRRSIPLALAITTIPLYISVAFSRLSFGPAVAASSRYTYLGIALLLPLIGQAATFLMRSRYLRPVVLSALVVLIGVNAVVLYRAGKSGYQAQTANQQRVDIQAAAYLIHAGEQFPSQDPAPMYNVYAPTMSQLRALIRRGQLSVPAAVSLRSLQAERAILATQFTSRQRGYPGTLAFSVGNERPTTAQPCLALHAGSSLLVDSRTPGSLRIGGLHSVNGVFLNIDFPKVGRTPGNSAFVKVRRSDQWLNLPGGVYPIAVVVPTRTLQICEAT
jgi:hypothetical protein